MKKVPAPSVPLTNGALITRREITLGLGHTALVEIRYDGPNQSAPDTGAEWPPETDWPAARLTLTLPNSCGYIPHRDLLCPVNVLGRRITYDAAISPETWGNDYSSAKGIVHQSIRRAGTSLRTLAAQMLRELLAELRPVQAHVKAREARLAQREDTLLAGHDVRPLKETATN